MLNGNSVDWAEFWLSIDYFQWVAFTTPEYIHRNVLKSRATFDSYVRMRQEIFKKQGGYGRL